MAPRALTTADVTGASYDNVVWGETSYKPSQSQTALQIKKKKPLYLSHGWCYDYQYGSYNILEYKLFSADSSFSVFVESEVAVVLFLL